MSFTNQQSDGLIRIGGLWKTQSKDGKAYLSGSFGGAKLMIFPNKFRSDNQSDPEYVVCIAASKPKKKVQQTESEDFI